MDNVLNIGLQIIVWFQNLGAWLTPVMKLLTYIGSTEFYLFVLPVILWCIDPPFGIRLGLFLMINATINAGLKVVFHGPRPYWYSSHVQVLGSTENSFGVPSGHAQNSVVAWGTLTDRIKNRAAWIIAVIMMFLIGISRLYLAAHFPHDVLFGWIIGALMLWILLRFEKPVVKWLMQFPIGLQLLIIFLFSLFLILIVLLTQLSLRGWAIPMDWINNARLAFPNEPVINPLSFHTFLPTTGVFFGLASGWMWISKLGGFSTNDPLIKLFLRLLVGLIGALILYLGLGSLFPDTETVISYVIQYIRYALIGFWISGFAPWLFVKLRLASHLK